MFSIPKGIRTVIADTNFENFNQIWKALHKATLSSSVNKPTHMWIGERQYEMLLADQGLFEIWKQSLGILIIPIKGLTCIMLAEIPSEVNLDLTALPIGYPCEYMRRMPSSTCVVVPSSLAEITQSQFRI